MGRFLAHGMCFPAKIQLENKMLLLRKHPLTSTSSIIFKSDVVNRSYEVSVINSHSIPQLLFSHKPTASEGAYWVFPTRASKCFGKGGGKQCNTSGFPNNSHGKFSP